ncbi:ATP-binding cassette domain-containing protein [Tropicibacter sp. Alg240-R139]|uniref:ATP-binding cassette domain-containing protein n=1 Tax=Tropicibacter sp. Alg240-R139 TaxID=2305991 RepID=UPI0013DFA20A|nr:ATP-binding cassette domain-containing protein [Tropicibacter sp. Alg240-R139]
MVDDNLLTIRNPRIERYSGNGWNKIFQGINLGLNRGEVLGLTGESGAGKSTVGLAAMGYCRDGCHISGGTIDFVGTAMSRHHDVQMMSFTGSTSAGKAVVQGFIHL